MDVREAAERLVDLHVWELNEETGETEPHLDRSWPDYNQALTELRDALAEERKE